MDATQRIIHEIDTSPMNRGLRGTDWVADPRNICLIDGDDMALFDYLAPGQYAIHLFFQSRGRAAIEQVKKATYCMFVEHGAQMLYANVPAFRKDVDLVARLAGWRYMRTQTTEHGPVRVYLTAPEMH
jgi:hypothetical protein